jgi:precorrin-6A/cobalt-precorrin-6A reductase
MVGVHFPVTVAGQPRICTVVPCDRGRPYQSTFGSVRAGTGGDPPLEAASPRAGAGAPDGGSATPPGPGQANPGVGAVLSSLRRVPRPCRLLLLGGTTEASALARRLAGSPGVTVITSLAGRTSRPSVPPGQLRVGGFGGTAGLLDYLRSEAIDMLIDATHPFAAVMRWHAEEACRVAAIPRLRIERPPWLAGSGDRWTHAATLVEAGRHVATADRHRVLLTTGRTGLEAFTPAVAPHRWWLVRCIEAPSPLPLHPAEVVLSRGPYALDGEVDLLASQRIDLLVTKNSGGTAAVAKLDAARSLGVEVLMVDRPPPTPGPTVPTVDEAAAWVDARSDGAAPRDPGGPVNLGKDIHL